MPKTELQPKDLFEKRNTSDIFNRQVIMGLLRVVNRKLVYDIIWDKDDCEQMTVATFFDFGGGSQSSERFIQDNYTFFSSDECTDIGLKKIDGNFDFYPQGRLSLSSVSIQSGNITNRFSMAQYQKLVDGRLQTFTSYLYSIPLEFSFTLEIRAENMTTAFKIDQNVREFFYKNHTYRFNYNGTILSARAGFPESGLSLAGTNYQMGQAQQENFIKLSYPIHVETYQPCFDRFNERPADNTIKSPGMNIYVNEKTDANVVGRVPDGTLQDGRRDKIIRWKTQFSGTTLTSGMERLIEWEWEYSDNDLLKVDIFYKLDGDEREYPIAMGEDNHDFFFWEIPANFTKRPEIDVYFPQSEYSSVATEPVVLIWPDPTTRMVETDNVYVKSKGFFVTSNPSNRVPAVIEYATKDGRIVQIEAEAPLNNYMLDAEKIPLDFECFIYEGVMNPKKVKLFVRDHNDTEIQAESNWFYIV